MNYFVEGEWDNPAGLPEKKSPFRTEALSLGVAVGVYHSMLGGTDAARLKGLRVVDEAGAVHYKWPKGE